MDGAVMSVKRGMLLALAGAALFASASVASAQQRPVQVAQAHVFDVYIDGQGRQVIVDSQTGQVVEVRPPGEDVQGRDYYPAQPQSRQSDLGRGGYDMGDPRDVERMRRDREAELGRRELPRRELRGGQYDRDIDGDYERPNDGGSYDRNFPAAPPNYDANGGYRPGSIERSPLNNPQQPDSGLNSNDHDLASVPGTLPEPGLASPETPDTVSPDAGSLQPKELQPFEPAHGITVPGARGATNGVAEFQVLLDRAGASPGVIDGRMGDNVNKAIDAYREITGRTLKTYDKAFIEQQLEATGGPAFTEYTITNEDAAGPYIASVPSDYSEKAQLERLGYTSVPEMLAERFHMDEGYLKSLNPQANFKRPGTIIKVVNPGKPQTGEVASIIADKSRKQVRAYDASGKLLAAYPATIGSTDTPSPTGTHAVERIAFNPNYTYNPQLNFKQGKNDKILTIPPGPNGPVGSIWIALDKPTYGVHGTPDPSTIGKTSSHGCVRLTNWDATELAKMVKPGVTVQFTD